MIIPGLDLLSNDEQRTLLTKAENLWRRLQKNDLGGYSDGNRPFYIFEMFKEVIEDYGKRDIGQRYPVGNIERHKKALEEQSVTPGER